ncbi:hypothetical protein F5I97DRAFT_483446 [Phlebopus sp. FC_14]|nr:hypothetical protein F5I97DRAFT_483446 [Phlebopus sp. FC_14]
MATFASPAPRRTHRHATPRQSSATPPRQRRLVGTRVVSGATPARSTTPAMDVDETPTPAAYAYNERMQKEKDTVFAKTEELEVRLYGMLPVEVRHVLRSTDFLAESYIGVIDNTSGYTLIASGRTCFVWSHASLRPNSSSPTCYILPCPPPSQEHPNATLQAPYYALVPSRLRSIEPGLILISPTGAARFWPSISSGLSGGTTFEALQLPLEAVEGEYVSCFVRGDQGGTNSVTGGGAYVYLVATSTGRIFRIGVTSQGGRHTLTTRLFAPPPPSSSLSLARFLGWSAPSQAPRPEPGNVVALVPSRNDIYVLVETRVQKWGLGTEEIMFEVDVAEIVREAIGGAVGVEDLEGVDLAVESQNMLVLLVSYASTSSAQDPASMIVDQFGSAPRRVYSIVRIMPHGDSWVVNGVVGVPYVATAASLPAHPRLTLLAGGTVIAVLFGDVLILCARDTPYQDRLVLKSPTDRLFGLTALPSVITLDHASLDADSHMDMDGAEEAEVIFMTSQTMLRMSVNVENVKGFRVESVPNLLKGTLKQAILYSPIPTNPLQFILPPSPVLDGEALMRAAEKTSVAVIASDSEIVRPNHDLSSQLTARKERLSWLIRFINDNGALGKMSQRSRQRLAIDAEKLYACHQLWIRLNEHIDSGTTHSLVTDIIHAFTASHASSNSTPSSSDPSISTPEQTPSHDVVRDFFKYRVSDVGALLVFMVQYLGRRGGKGMGGVGALKEIGGSVVTTLQAAVAYRAYNLGVYGVELPMLRPWTSRPAMIDAVLKLVEAVTRIATEGGGASASANGNTKELVGMLPELATLLFACIQERLDWLGSPMAAEIPASERERKALEDKFAQLRPEILETLRLTSHLPQALSLATTYTDFPSLASLLILPNPYPPSANPNAQLIKDYLNRYGNAFGREVVRWCIEHGEARVIFAEEAVWADVMDSLFEGKSRKGKAKEGTGVNGTSEYNAIAWVNDMGRRRFGEASGRLLREAKGAGEVGVRHFMLSLGKLAHLSQLQEDRSVDEATLDAFHDGLDFIAVQEKLLKDFQEALASVRGKQKQSMDAQLDAIVRTKATRLRESERKGLIQIFKDHVRKVLQGKMLTVEDVVDILTLKDNGESIEDYATALHLLVRAEDVPDARRLSSFRRAWCRVYNHDDWDAIRRTANITDAQLTARFRATALYHTLSLILPTLFSISPNELSPEGFDLDPSQCLPVPLMPETSSRFPGMPVEMVGELARDFRAESSAVEAMKLEDVYFRVRELVIEDSGNGQM